MSSMLPEEGAFLEDGWSPDLDPADSLVRQAVMVHAQWAVDLARTLGRPWHDGPTWAGGSASDRGVFSNWIVPKQPSVPLQEVVADAAEVFADGVPFILIGPWPSSAATRADLASAGVRLLGHPPLMVRFPSSPVAAPDTDLDVRWVTTPDELAAAEEVLVEGFPLEELQPATPGCVYAPELLQSEARFVLVYDGDQPVATAAAFSAHGVTLVEGVAALPSARGRGAGAAAAWAATTAVADQPAVLMASDDGQPVYQRMGYVRLERWTGWMRPPS